MAAALLPLVARTALLSHLAPSDIFEFALKSLYSCYTSTYWELCGLAFRISQM